MMLLSPDPARQDACNNPMLIRADKPRSQVPSFQHRQTAHCESGAISALLRHSGLDLSEAMAFGLSGALTFAYIPLLKMGGMPIIAYRMPPGAIIRGLTRALRIPMHAQRFRNPDAGTRALDALLDAGHPVGLQTSVYWLPYFPPDMRFHFNAHNLVAYGRAESDYLISDPTFEEPVSCDGPSLQRARFVRGMLAPRGLLYYPLTVPQQPDLAPLVLRAIQRNARMLLKTPLPIIGIRGIRNLAAKIRRLARHHDRDADRNKLFIGHIVRMQEEIGTGGAGFRFLYASFLQESAAATGSGRLAEASHQLTAAGDEWRRFALLAAKMCKQRMPMDYDRLAAQLELCAEHERAVFEPLLQATLLRS